MTPTPSAWPSQDHLSCSREAKTRGGLQPTPRAALPAPAPVHGVRDRSTPSPGCVVQAALRCRSQAVTSPPPLSKGSLSQREKPYRKGKFYWKKEEGVKKRGRLGAGRRRTRGTGCTSPQHAGPRVGSRREETGLPWAVPHPRFTAGVRGSRHPPTSLRTGRCLTAKSPVRIQTSRCRPSTDVKHEAQPGGRAASPGPSRSVSRAGRRHRGPERVGSGLSGERAEAGPASEPQAELFRAPASTEPALSSKGLLPHFSRSVSKALDAKGLTSLHDLRRQKRLKGTEVPKGIGTSATNTQSSLRLCNEKMKMCLS